MNKTSIIIILFLLFAKLGYSQPTEINPNGYNIFYHESGSKSSEGFLKDGKPNGYWKTYYPNEVLKTEGNRRDFLLDSTWIFYNKVGDTTQKINYLRGEKNGYYYKYNTTLEGKKNTVASKEMFINDKKEGKSYYFYDTGELHKIINYENNVREKKSYEYDTSGVIITINQYRYNNLVDRDAINRYDFEGKKHGEWIEFYDNFKIKTKSYYKKGLLNGNYQEFSKSGKLLKNERYKDGELIVAQTANTNQNNINQVPVNIKKEYYESGQIKSIGTYTENKLPVGVHKVFSETGAVVSATTYDDLGIKISEGIIDTSGLRQGDWTLFYPEGEKRAEGKYKNNNRVGEWSFLFENGNLEQKGNYKKGKPDGKWQWFYETGELLREETYEDGYEQGKAYELTISGDTIYCGKFEYGQKHGNWYYSIGDEYIKGKYKYDQKDGIWEHYYFPEMQLKQKGLFTQGKEQEKHKFYYPSGKLKEQGEYLSGNRDGTWRFYDQDGNLKTTITYSFGKMEKIDGVKIEDKKKKK